MLRVVNTLTSYSILPPDCSKIWLTGQKGYAMDHTGKHFVIRVEGIQATRGQIRGQNKHLPI